MPGQEAGEEREEALPLDHENHQGNFGEAFVRTMAVAAGLLISKPVPDYDGVDFSLKYPGARGTKYFPQIDVQVKSWRAARGSGAHWSYRLTAKHFNELAGGFDIPRFLFLVVVPREIDAYTKADDQCLRLYRACYWASLHSLDPLWEVPGGNSVGVEVPKANLLTVDSLLERMTKPAVPRETP